MKKFLTSLITIYQHTLTHFTPKCRYSPTCSAYMKEAIEKYGVKKGFIMGVKRIGTCHPFSSKGYWDPVE